MNFGMQMPVIILSDEMTQEEIAIIKPIIGHGGKLRSAKPFKKPNTLLEAQANVVWRWVAFSASTNRQHHCLPCSVDFDLFDFYRLDAPHKYGGYKYDHDTIRAEHKRLQRISDKVLEKIHPSQYYGIRRWGKALNGYDPLPGGNIL